MESARLHHRRNFPQPKPINPGATAREFFLESRCRKIVLAVGWHESKEIRFPSQSRDAREIIKVIGCDPQNSVLFQRRPDRSQEIRCHHPAPMMPSFWPGVGKEEMESFYRSFWQQIPDGIRRFEMQHTHIVDPGRFATGFFDPTGKALDAKKVFSRICAASVKRKAPSPQPRSTWSGASRPKIFSGSRRAVHDSGINSTTETESRLAG